MERKTLVTTEQGKEVEIEYPEVLKVVEFTPLLDRIEEEQPELLSCLINLYEKIGVDNFADYINNLISIKKHEEEMLIITRFSWQKSIIEREFLKSIQESFAVTKVRIISQN
ncbi:MAG: hypothetical protein GX923_02700 [Clostridia bacterium]|nr:hypothetical protein [Clostridia bacterium]